MQYSNALKKILNGMSSDNAIEIESGAQMLIALVGDVPLSGAERKMATHLTKRVPDLWDSAPLQALSTLKANPLAEHLSTPPTSG